MLPPCRPCRAPLLSAPVGLSVLAGDPTLPPDERLARGLLSDALGHLVWEAVRQCLEGLSRGRGAEGYRAILRRMASTNRPCARQRGGRKAR